MCWESCVSQTKLWDELPDENQKLIITQLKALDNQVTPGNVCVQYNKQATMKMLRRSRQWYILRMVPLA